MRLEKAASIGGHALSGAVLEPAALDALWPEWRQTPPAICVPVTRDEFRLLKPQGSMRLPVPPQQRNHGNLIVSLGQLLPLLAAHAESLGRSTILPGAGHMAHVERPAEVAALVRGLIAEAGRARQSPGREV